MKPRRNILFVIAIDNYLSHNWDNLQNPVSDSKELIKVLVERYSFELYPEPIYNEGATKQEIYNSLNTLAFTLNEDDNLIIFFAGHGQMHPIIKKGYWVPYEGTESLDTLVENSVIKDFIEGIPAKHIWLIADSCYSGSFLTRTRGAALDITYHKLDLLTSRWMLASGGEEKVSDGKAGKNSPFARYLIKCLSENTNKFISVKEIARYVSLMTSNNSKQKPQGASISSVGHNGGEMVLILREQDVKQKYERTTGITNSPNLKKDQRSSQKWKHNIPTGKELLFVQSFVEGVDFLILENFRFDDEGKKTIIFKNEKAYLPSSDGSSLEVVLIRRYATWQGLTRFFDESQNLYKGKDIKTIGAAEEIDNVEETKPAIEQSEYLEELLLSNKDIMACLHCGIKISTNDSLYVEIDEEGLKDNIGNVHKECLRNTDRIIGKAIYSGLKNDQSPLINFDHEKWISLLERGQGQIQAVKTQFPDQKLKLVSWNSENLTNEGEYCVRISYEDGSSSYMTSGKNIHRFKKSEIDKEIENFNRDYAVSKESQNPFCKISETGLFGSYNKLEGLKTESQTIVLVKNFEKARYSKQFESNEENFDNDYTPIGIVCYSESSDYIKIDDFILLISDPFSFEKYYNNWKDAGVDLTKCVLRVVESDLELDKHLTEFFANDIRPIIDPLFNKDLSLSSGSEIKDIKAIISEAKERIYWQKGDKVKVVFPDVKTDKFATGFLLEDEFLDETGRRVAIFQPVENEVPLKDMQYLMPVMLFQKIKQ